MAVEPVKYIMEILEGSDPSEPPPSETPWNEIATILQTVDPADRTATLRRWVALSNGAGEQVMWALTRFRNRNQEDEVYENQQLGRLWSLDDLLVSDDFRELPVLVGEPNNAIIVRGEGHFMVGAPGVGKTLLTLDGAISLAAGKPFLGYRTVGPLSVLILQAELPISFLKTRFAHLVDGHEFEHGEDFRPSLRNIHIQTIDHPIDLGSPESRRLLLNAITQVAADVVFIDPFLSFFRGEENSNGEVRDILDALKFEVAAARNCALILTDHISKADPGRGARARGASAKIDWASLVINLSNSKLPVNDSNSYISATLTKVRYGRGPEEPIILRRDFVSLRHTIWVPEQENKVNQVRDLIASAGGEVTSQRDMVQRIKDTFTVGSRRARGILQSAIDSGSVEQLLGANRAHIYRLPSTDESSTDE